jgi:hypothetical protein
MPEGIPDRVKGKIQQIKQNTILIQYLMYIVISILLGIILKYKLFDMFVLLINSSVNILSLSSIDHSLVFSTSAAILSTVFTIIFVILTVFVQVSDVSVSADIFRNNETKYLIVLYFGTIVLSLMMLETTFQFPILVLILTIACILSLYPFLLNFSDRLEYEVSVGKLTEKIISLMDSNKEFLALGKIISLSKICERSINDGRWIVFIEITSILEKITKMAKEKRMVEVIKIIGTNYSNLLYTIIKYKPTINKNSMFFIMKRNILIYVSDCSDMVDSTFLNSILVMIPLNTVTKRIKDCFEEDFFDEQIVILCYKSYSIWKKRDGNNFQMEQGIIDSLGELAKESYNHNLSRSLTISIGALFEIGVKESQEKIKSVYLSALVLNKLEDIEKHIHHNNFEKVYDDFNDISHISWAFGEPELEPYFAQFKEIYDKSKQFGGLEN